MRLSKPRSPWLQFDRLAMAACLLLLATTVTAAEGPDTSLLTDPEVPSQESVAHELLEIQRHLGGSIVSDRRALRGIPSSSIEQAEATDFPDAVGQLRSGFPGSQATLKSANPSARTVKSLRNAAWQLDLSAEKLERSELYKQADALRNLAQQFRLDARAIFAQPGE